VHDPAALGGTGADTGAGRCCPDEQRAAVGTAPAAARGSEHPSRDRTGARSTPCPETGGAGHGDAGQRCRLGGPVQQIVHQDADPVAPQDARLTARPNAER
jgi:hypothetical protein